VARKLRMHVDEHTHRLYTKVAAYTAAPGMTHSCEFSEDGMRRPDEIKAARGASPQCALTALDTEEKPLAAEASIRA